MVGVVQNGSKRRRTGRAPAFLGFCASTCSFFHQFHDVSEAPLRGECYLGIIALGRGLEALGAFARFFAFHFMDTSERQSFLRSTVFGGVTFQKTVPLSYWDAPRKHRSMWPVPPVESRSIPPAGPSSASWPRPRRRCSRTCRPGGRRAQWTWASRASTWAPRATASPVARPPRSASLRLRAAAQEDRSFMRKVEQNLQGAGSASVSRSGRGTKWLDGAWL